MKLLSSCVAFLLFAVAAHAQDLWQPRASGVTVPLWSVAYAANQWVAVGEQGTILTSPDGAAWTPRVSGFPSRWLVGVGYGAPSGSGLWVVVGESGLILTSPDAITWTPRKSAGTRINAVAWGNGTFVAGDDAGSTLYSTDGITWSGPFFGRTTFTRGLVYGAPHFVTTGLAQIQTTYDGITSTTRSSSPQLQAAAYGRRLYLATGGASTYTSRDAINWTLQPATTAIGVQGATFFNNQFVAVGNGGGITTTFDGSAWTDRASGTTQILLAVAAAPDSAVAVGFAGTILQSSATPSAPTVTISPSTVVEAAGGNVAFTATARGSAPLTYQWRKDGTDISGATTDTLFLANVQTAQNGSYTCLVANAVGSALSPAATLNVVATFPLPDPVDPTFTLGPSLNVSPSVAATQPDGKILIGGNFLLLNEGQAQFGLARLTSAGALDTSFKPGAIDPNGRVNAIAVQPDGKILIGGSFTSINGTARSRLARLNADGSLDTAFVPVYSSTTTISQIALTSDGLIYVVNGTDSLLRLTSSGALDPAWSFAGVTTVAGFLGTFQLGTVQAIALQSDGKAVLAIRGFLGEFIRTVRRVNTNGSADPTFISKSFTLDGSFLALRVLADGRIMIAAAVNGLIISRYTTDGLIDATFTPTISSPSSPSAVAFTSDGRTWLGGGFTTIGGSSRNQLARLSTDGTLDATYSAGSGVFNSSNNFVGPSFILPFDDGRALALGDFTRINTTSRSQLARLNSFSFAGANAPTIVALDSYYRELRAGEPFSVQISASGSPTFSYGGSNPTGNPSFAALSAFTFPSSLVGSSGTYTVAASNPVSVVTQTFYVRTIPSAPFIIAQPSALQTNTGRSLTLSVTSGGGSGNTYQWFKNGSPITRATAATYTVDARFTTTADIGDYTVVIRNSLGFATSQTIHVGVDETARFINLATRGNVGRSDSLLIVGFVIQGPGTKRVMLRAVGPTLAQFGVTGALADPFLRVFNGAGAQIYSNDDWSSSNDIPGVATGDSRLGAFPLPTGSLDAAGILTLTPGSYTAVISGKNIGTTETTGIALAEIYEDDSSSARLVNLSSRGVVSPGASVMIPAFVTSTTGGTTPKKFLIRGVGPGLAQFGVANVLANPTLTITNSAGLNVATNDDWETNSNVEELRTITSQLGFPLAPGSKDAALLISLPPGGYTIQVSGVANTSGTALVEVYEVP